MGSKLREVAQVTQSEHLKARRWFNSAEADLYVWQQDGEIEHFEYSYDKPHDEHILVWKIGAGFRHLGVDDGEANPGKNQSPIIKAQIKPDFGRIARDFRESGVCIEPVIYRFVISKLYENL